MVKIADVPWDSQGTLKSRPNRFLAIVDIEQNGTVLKDQKVHVRDPGRLKELLYPGNKVLVKHRPGENRKTQWEIIAALDDDWILINSGYHRAISEAILRNPEISPFGKLDRLKAEVSVGHSRLDFMLEKDGQQIGLEIKGCTLEIREIALFPDAPTERGAKHVESLKGLVEGELLELRPDQLREASGVIAGLPGVLEVQTYGDLLHVFVDDAMRRASEIEAALGAASIAIEGLRQTRPRMEEAFISLIRRRLEEG